jgi:hypothetical protein
MHSAAQAVNTPQITMYELEKNGMPLHEAMNKLREKAQPQSAKVQKMQGRK